MLDYLIVGAGFSGSVLAERLATQQNKSVLVIDKRDHIGGNAYDYFDEQGVLIHKYGPHIFHTNQKPVVDYLSQFTTWRPYEHRVLAEAGGIKYPFPINRTTINALYGASYSSDEQIAAFYESQKEVIDHPANAEEKVLSTVGRDLYERFFKGYTTKQWGCDPKSLLASVTARIPLRTNDDDRYFTDSYQMMPNESYTALFKRMLDHRNISIELNCDFFKKEIPHRHLIFTGPIDSYFDYKFGKLPYRSLRFAFQHFPQNRFQEAATINYSNDHAYTRITEFKYLTGQICDGTTIGYEYPDTPENCGGETYYPIPTSDNEKLYRRYADEAKKLKNVTFLGRLGDYKYYNMDHAIMRALNLFKYL